MTAPSFDETAAHRWYSARCFNATWDFLDQPSRTPEDNRQMILTAMASLWHWSQRPDVDDEKWSVGCWLISRAHAVAGDAVNARTWAETCRERSGALAPFFQGYAYEALARAAKLAGDETARSRWLHEARGQTERVESAEERRMLENDLADI